MKTVKCKICGKEFTTDKPNKKYCSFTCKEAGYKLRRLKWQDAHPDYITEYIRDYRKQKKAQA